MDEDNPDYLVHETLHPETSGRITRSAAPSSGTTKTVSSFDQHHRLRLLRQPLHPRNMVFSAAGNLDHDSLRSLR